MHCVTRPLVMLLESRRHLLPVTELWCTEVASWSTQMLDRASLLSLLPPGVLCWPSHLDECHIGPFVAVETLLCHIPSQYCLHQCQELTGHYNHLPWEIFWHFLKVYFYIFEHFLPMSGDQIPALGVRIHQGPQDTNEMIWSGRVGRNDRQDWESQRIRRSDLVCLWNIPHLD